MKVEGGCKRCHKFIEIASINRGIIVFLVFSDNLSIIFVTAKLAF